MSELDSLIQTLVAAPLGQVSADERDALREVDDEPLRWLSTDEIRAALGDSPAPSGPQVGQVG